MNEIDNNISNLQPDSENEIILYQPDSTLSLDVRVENETVWLTQAQMTELFQSTKQNISLHINNIFKEGELDKISVVKDSLTTAADGKRYKTKLYSLDVIISVGYRVKSIRGTQFRIWANKILKDYLLRGYSVNQRLLYMESRIDRRLLEHDKRLDDLTGKVDFFLKTSLPPREGVLFDGQIFDAYSLISDLIRKATNRIVLIDNYVDDRILKVLTKRKEGVSAIIYTDTRHSQISNDLRRHNAQYPRIEVRHCTNVHDRFLIIDDTVYFIGGSIKDLGKKIVAFSQMHQNPDTILTKLR